jgi:subtilisin family serine protease
MSDQKPSESKKSYDSRRIQAFLRKDDRVQRRSLHQSAITGGTLVLWLLSIIGLAGLSQSCGRPHVRLSKKDLDRSYRAQYVATEANVSNWAPLWDKQSWIVALPDQGSEDVDPRYLRSQLIDDITEYFSPLLQDNSLAQFRDSLGTDLNLDLSLSLGAINRANPLGDRGPSNWFARVTFPQARSPWQGIVGVPIVTDILPDAVVHKLAIAQLRALSAASRFEWVEPNLGADPMQDTGTEPADSERDAVGGRPEEWFSKDGEPLDRDKNRIRQVFTRINWHNAQATFKKIQDQNPDLKLGKAEIPVAVIDTGVDYEHPDLKDRMFKNPGETEGNGIDDDRNGYIDDVYGIDATIPKGQIDRSFQPTGPADVGGPGVACETPGEQGRNGGTCGHGTHVAGIVAAQSGGKFAVGLCDACKVYAVRASKKCLYPDTTLKGGACITPKSPPNKQADPPQYIANGKIFDWDQIAGLNYILDFVNPENGQLRIFIINLSLGKYIYNRTMASVLSKLEESGVLVIAAAGNDNTETPMFPAGYASSLSVCATSEDEGTGSYGRRGKYAKADFSNFGDWVDVCAPGVEIQSTFPGNEVKVETGTSMASPLVAGAAGYIWSILYNLGGNSKLSQENSFSIRGRIERFADPSNLYSDGNIPNRYYGRAVDGVSNYLLGTGMLDVNRALLGDTSNATSSYVANERSTGSSSQVTSGCIVSTIGHNHARWKLVDIVTTMPFLMIQFLGFIFWRRRIRSRPQNN